MSTQPGRRPPVTRARIAEAGGVIADAEGFSAVTASSVARALGIRTASLYAHVPGTTGAREQVTLLALRELADAALLAAAGRSGFDALRSLADAFRTYARAHPGRFEATAGPLSDELASSSAGPVHAHIMKAILTSYGIGTSPGDIQQDAALQGTVQPSAIQPGTAPPASAEQTHAARYVGGTIHGFIRQELHGSYAHSPASVDESWARALQALHVSLLQWDKLERNNS